MQRLFLFQKNTKPRYWNSDSGKLGSIWPGKPINSHELSIHTNYMCQKTAGVHCGSLLGLVNHYMGGSSTKSWGLKVPRGQSYLEDSKWDNRTYPTDKHVYNPKSQCNEPSRGEGMIKSICNFPGFSGTRAMRIKAVVMKHGMVPAPFTGHWCQPPRSTTNSGQPFAWRSGGDLAAKQKHWGAKLTKDFWELR